MAVNFIKDIFGFGDPEKPFSLIDFFLGEDGPVMNNGTGLKVYLHLTSHLLHREYLIWVEYLKHLAWWYCSC